MTSDPRPAKDRRSWRHRWGASLAALVGAPALIVGLMVGPAAAASGAGQVREYAGISDAAGIVSGPDGALWFTDTGNNSVGRITTTGQVTTFTGASIAVPEGITLGPDGALWFTDTGTTRSAGSPRRRGHRLHGTGNSGPVGITAGPDGALWFINAGNGTIGRITTGGTISAYTGSGIGPHNITSGPDGALWFTDDRDVGRPNDDGRGVTDYTGPGATTRRDHDRDPMGPCGSPTTAPTPSGESPRRGRHQLRRRRDGPQGSPGDLMGPCGSPTSITPSAG